MPSHHCPNRAAGFTLVELMVCIAIIALMVSVLLPALGMAREAAVSAKCLSNLRQIGLACHLYENDYQVMPVPKSTASWRGGNGGAAMSAFAELMVKATDYLPNSQPEGPEVDPATSRHSAVLQCPGDRTPPTDAAGRARYWRSYVYRTSMDGIRAIMSTPPDASPVGDPFGSDLWYGAYAQAYPKPILFDSAHGVDGAVVRFSYSGMVSSTMRGSNTLGGMLATVLGGDAPERWTLDSPWHSEGVNVFFHDGRAGRVGSTRQMGLGPGN